MDVEMPARHRYGRPLTRAVQSGVVSEQIVDEAVNRVLATRLLFALAPDREEYPETVIACPEHVALARDVAEQSAVLLKNDGVLPFAVDATRKLAVIGRLGTASNTGDRGSSHVRAPYVVSPADGLCRYLGERGGAVLVNDGVDVQAAVDLATETDAVVIVVGYTADDEGEYFVLNPNRREKAWRPSFFGGGGDRSDLRLRSHDLDLLARLTQVNPNTVVVLMVGSAVSVAGWGDSAPAILLPFYNGMEGGTALARLLFGEISPSGKLPFTMPTDPADLPPFDPFAERADYSDDHGYIRFDKKALPVSFPFGHGLSYSRFSCTDLSVNTPEVGIDGTVELSVLLRNEGSCRAAEVVQLYLAYPDSAVERPVKLLRGFEKVSLDSGESRRVQFALPVAETAYYDPRACAWTVERLRHTLLVGTSSAAEQLLESSFVVR